MLLVSYCFLSSKWCIVLLLFFGIDFGAPFDDIYVVVVLLPAAHYMDEDFE
jgi:hypothetical protein